MKRIDKVQNALQKLSVKVVNQIETNEKFGISAKEIEEVTNIARANVSLELNNLVKQKKALKIKSYPVNTLMYRLLRLA